MNSDPGCVWERGADGSRLGSRLPCVVHTELCRVQHVMGGSDDHGDGMVSEGPGLVVCDAVAPALASLARLGMVG